MTTPESTKDEEIRLDELESFLVYLQEKEELLRRHNIDPSDLIESIKRQLGK